MNLADTLALQLVAIDYDTGNNAVIQFTEVFIPENEQGQKLFRVNTDGQVLTDRSLPLRTDQDKYNCTVRATDQNGNGLSSKCPIVFN